MQISFFPSKIKPSDLRGEKIVDWVLKTTTLPETDIWTFQFQYIIPDNAISFRHPNPVQLSRQLLVADIRTLNVTFLP